MKIEVVSIKAYKNTSDLKMIAFFENDDIITACHGIDEEIGEGIKGVVKDNEFTGKYGEIHSFRLPRKEKPNKILMAGRGKLEELNTERIRKIFAKIFKEARKLKATSIEIPLLGGARQGSLSIKEVTKIVTKMAIFTEYEFDKHKDEREKTTIESINIVCNDDVVSLAKEGLREGIILGNTTTLTRDLVNEPAKNLH